MTGGSGTGGASGCSVHSPVPNMMTTGFRTSRMGVEDQQYTGNVYVQEWTGCAPKVLDHLGVSKGIQIRFAESGSQSSTILL